MSRHPLAQIALGSDVRPEVVESGARKKNPLGRTRLGFDLYDLERIFTNL